MSVCNDDVYSPIERKFDPKIDVKCGKGSFDIVDKCCMKIIERSDTGDQWHKIVERDIALTKIKYPFLSDNQIRGKVLQKLGIPNFMGNIIRTGTNRVNINLAKELGLWSVKKEAKVPPPFRMLKKRPPGDIKKEMKQQPPTPPASQSSMSSLFSQSPVDENSNTNMKKESPSYIPDILLRKRPPSVDSTENDEELTQTPRKKRKLNRDDLQKMRRDWDDACSSTPCSSQSQRNSQNPEKMTKKHVTWSDSSSRDLFLSPSQTPTPMETPEEIRDAPNKWSQGSLFSLSSPETLNSIKTKTHNSQEKPGILKTPTRNYDQSADPRYRALRNLANQWEDGEKLKPNKQLDFKTAKNPKILQKLQNPDQSPNLEMSQNSVNSEISQNSLTVNSQNSFNFEVSPSSLNLEVPGNHQNLEDAQTSTNPSNSQPINPDPNDKNPENPTLTPIDNSPRISLDSQLVSSHYSPVPSIAASNSSDKENQVFSEEQGNAIFRNILGQLIRNSGTDGRSREVLREIPIPPSTVNPFAAFESLNSPDKDNFSSPTTIFPQKNLELSNSCKNSFNEAFKPIKRNLFSNKNNDFLENNDFFESNDNVSPMEVIIPDDENDFLDEEIHDFQYEKNSFDGEINSRSACYSALSEFLRFPEVTQYSQAEDLDSDFYDEIDSNIDENLSDRVVSTVGSPLLDFSSSDGENDVNSSQSVIFISDDELESSGRDEARDEIITNPEKIIEKIPEDHQNSKVVQSTQFFQENSQIFSKQSISDLSNLQTNKQKVNHCFTQIVVVDVEKEDSYEPEARVGEKSQTIQKNSQTLIANSETLIQSEETLFFTQKSVTNAEREGSGPSQVVLIERSQIIQEKSQICVITEDVAENCSQASNINKGDPQISNSNSPKTLQKDKERQSSPIPAEKRNSPIIDEKTEKSIDNVQKSTEVEVPELNSQPNANETSKNAKNGGEQDFESEISVSAEKSQLSDPSTFILTSPEVSQQRETENLVDFPSKIDDNVGEIIPEETAEDAGHFHHSNSSEITSSQSTLALPTDNSQENPWLNVTSQDFSPPLSEDSGVAATDDTVTSSSLCVFSSSDDSGLSDVESAFPSIREMVQVKRSSVKQNVDDLVEKLNNQSFESN